MAYDMEVRTGAAYIYDLTVKTIRGLAGMITNAMVSSSAAIASSKLVNRIQCVYQQADGANVASTSGDGAAVYVCDKTNGATIKKFTACCQDVGAGGSPAHNIAIDLFMWDDSAGSAASVLSADINITESEADYEFVNGTLSTTDMDVGDVLLVKVAVTGSGGTNPQGLVVQVEVDEEGA